MNSLFRNSELCDLMEKVEIGQRLEREDGLRLFASKDLLAIGYMADQVRRRQNGDDVYFIIDESPEEQPLVETSEQGSGISGSPSIVATMLYGQDETYEARVEQLLTLREAKLRSGLIAFAPVLVQSPGTGLSGVGITQLTGYDALKMLAVARLMLDNFTHISASLTQLGSKLAQVSLAFGVDDLHGHDIKLAQVLQLVRASGRIPVERNHSYDIIRKYV